MTVMQIITNSNKLHRVAEVIEDGLLIQSIEKDLLDTAIHYLPTYIGLAAPQIGYNVRMFVMTDKSQRKLLTVINPEIIRAAGKKKYLKEGCLSRPGVSVMKGRCVKIKVRYTDGNGSLIERNFSNINARVFQHELDHLNGILI